MCIILPDFKYNLKKHQHINENEVAYTNNKSINFRFSCYCCSWMNLQAVTATATAVALKIVIECSIYEYQYIKSWEQYENRESIE